MYVRIARRRGRGRRSCSIYEPPRFFEAFLRGRRYTEPPDITARICGICPVAYQMSACAAIEDACGVAGARADPAAAPAPLLRRVDREPRAARLHAPRAGLPRLRGRGRRWPRDHREVVERRAALKKAGNAIDRRSSAAARSTRSTCASAASTARRRKRELARAGRAAGARARAGARGGRAGAARSTFPDFEERLRVRRARASPTTTRSSAAGWRRARGLDIAPARVRGALRRGAGAALDRAALPAARARRLPRRARSPATRSTRDAAVAARARGRGRGRARAGVPQPVPQHRGARGRDPLRARRGAAHHRRLRGAGRARPSRSRRARATATAGPRRRAGCSATVTRSTSDGDDPRRQDRAADVAEPGSDRGGPARRSSAATSTATTRSCRLRCEQAIRNYDPCISCATHFLTLKVDRDAGPRWSSASGTSGAATTRAGLAVARRLRRGSGTAGARRGASRASRSALLERWAGAEQAIVVDAVSSGAAPGTIHRLDATERVIATRSSGAPPTPSGVAEAVELARALDRLPRRLLVLGIEGKRFGAGAGLSPEVEQAVDRLVAELRADARQVPT